jgi:hypothetical protein
VDPTPRLNLQTFAHRIPFKATTTERQLIPILNVSDRRSRKNFVVRYRETSSSGEALRLMKPKDPHPYSGSELQLVRLTQWRELHCFTNFK